MTSDDAIEFACWAWAKGGADVLITLQNLGWLPPESVAAFAKSWADTLDIAMDERNVAAAERLEALHQFDALINQRT